MWPATAFLSKNWMNRILSLRWLRFLNTGILISSLSISAQVILLDVSWEISKMESKVRPQSNCSLEFKLIKNPSFKCHGIFLSAILLDGVSLQIMVNPICPRMQSSSQFLFKWRLEAPYLSEFQTSNQIWILRISFSKLVYDQFGISFISQF